MRVITRALGTFEATAVLVKNTVLGRARYAVDTTDVCLLPVGRRWSVSYTHLTLPTIYSV